MKHILSAALISLALCSSCDKNKSGGGAGNYPSDLSGTIYYKWATEGIIKVSFPSATGGEFIQNDTKLNSFDISRDGQYRLTAVNASTVGNDNVKFTLSNNSTGAIINEFIYQSRARNRFCTGYLSPDNKLIMVESNDKDDGIVILKVTGEELLTIDAMNNVPFDIHDMKMWLPNNEILLTHTNKIIKLTPPYNSASLVKQMDYAEWGHLAVNQQGTQLAMHIANHIYTMGIDGNNLKQVTISDHKEARPVFSPDGKYLMIGSNYRQTSIMGNSWDMKIIPNDGKQYNVDPFAENSEGVISVVLDGKEKIVSGSGQVIWK